MKSICDECGLETNVEFIEADRPRGIKETYFRCDMCGTHYTCFVTDAKVRRMQKDIDKLRGTGTDITAPQDEVGRLMAKLKETFLERKEAK